MLAPGYPMVPVWPAIANINKYIHTYKYIQIYMYMSKELNNIENIIL